MCHFTMEKLKHSLTEIKDFCKIHMPATVSHECHSFLEFMQLKKKESDLVFNNNNTGYEYTCSKLELCQVLS